MTDVKAPENVRRGVESWEDTENHAAANEIVRIICPLTGSGRWVSAFKRQNGQTLTQIDIFFTKKTNFSIDKCGILVIINGDNNIVFAPFGANGIKAEQGGEQQ